MCSMVFFLLEFFPFFSVNGVTRTCILGNAGRLKLLGFFTILAVASPTNSGVTFQFHDVLGRSIFESDLS